MNGPGASATLEGPATADTACGRSSAVYASITFSLRALQASTLLLSPSFFLSFFLSSFWSPLRAQGPSPRSGSGGTIALFAGGLIRASSARNCAVHSPRTIPRNICRVSPCDLAAAFDACVRRFSLEDARRELVANSYADVESGDSLAQYERERESLNRSSSMLEEYTEMMRSSLGRLRRQREYIKQFQRTMMDMSNTLGLSQGVMRIAGRRNAGDKMFVYGGMAFTLLFMYLFWSWRR